MSSSPGSRYALTATRSPGVSRHHTLLYRSGRDSRIDRWNIALLKRVVKKSTTHTSLEVYYHELPRLSDWAEPQERVKYTRLRGDETSHFPYAERIAAASGVVVVVDNTLLARAGDIWRLMARAEQHAVVTLGVVRVRRGPGEAIHSFLWRAATAALQRHLYPQGPIGAFAVNKSLTAESGFREKVRHFGFLRSLYPAKPDILIADGYAVAGTPAPVLLATGAATAEAMRFWKNQKAFPWWFSGKFFLFHVAQLAAYYGALVALLAPAASLAVFGFAILITPGYFFRNLPWRHPHHAMAQMAARFFLYFAG